MTSHRLQNDEGAGVVLEPPSPLSAARVTPVIGLTVLSGEGAYDALSLVLSQTYEGGDTAAA